MQGAVISRTIAELLCFSGDVFFLVSWNIPFLSTMENTPIALDSLQKDQVKLNKNA